MKRREKRGQLIGQGIVDLIVLVVVIILTMFSLFFLRYKPKEFSPDIESYFPSTLLEAKLDSDSRLTIADAIIISTLTNNKTMEKEVKDFFSRYFCEIEWKKQEVRENLETSFSLEKEAMAFLPLGKKFMISVKIKC